MPIFQPPEDSSDEEEEDVLEQDESKSSQNEVEEDTFHTTQSEVPFFSLQHPPRTSFFEIPSESFLSRKRKFSDSAIGPKPSIQPQTRESNTEISSQKKVLTLLVL